MKPTIADRRLLLAALLASSGLATVCGMQMLIRFDETAGWRSKAAERWPEESMIHRPFDSPGLVLFAHPFCSCTEATIEELERILARRREAQLPSITVVLAPVKKRLPQGSGRIVYRAERLPGAKVIWDEGGREAQRFGSHTSGEVFLYDRRGKLIFHGGITGSRGHAGDNYGAEQVLTALTSGRLSHSSSPVFGCALAAQWPTPARAN